VDESEPTLARVETNDCCLTGQDSVAKEQFLMVVLPTPNLLATLLENTPALSSNGIVLSYFISQNSVHVDSIVQEHVRGNVGGVFFSLDGTNCRNLEQHCGHMVRRVHVSQIPSYGI